MRIGITLLGGAAALALLSGCGGGAENSGVLGPEDERALDNAAAMVNESNLEVPDDSMVANEAEIQAQENAADAGNAADNAQ
jgi:hypothetical protein